MTLEITITDDHATDLTFTLVVDNVGRIIDATHLVARQGDFECTLDREATHILLDEHRDELAEALAA